MARSLYTRCLDLKGSIAFYSGKLFLSTSAYIHIFIRDSITRINSDSQGDFIATSDRGSLSIQTLADYSHAQPPLVDFSTPAPVIRDRPEPVDAGGIVSWLWSTKLKTGAEIDTCCE